MPDPAAAPPGGPPLRAPWRLAGGALALYAAAALLLTWPLAAHLADHLVSHANPAARSDPPLNAWILSWTWHALTTAPGRLFQANAFFPAPDALAFSDTLLGTLPLFAPAFALTGNPVLAANLATLLAFVLNGAAMAALAFRLLARPLPALVAGFVFAFSPLRFGHLMHLQLLSAWWTPLCLLALEAWLRRPRPLSAAAVGALLWVQFLSSAYLGLALGLLLPLYGLVRAWPERQRLGARRLLAGCALAALVAGLLLLPVAVPYLRSQAQWAHARGLTDLFRYSAHPQSLLAADATSRLYGELTRPFRRHDVPWESALFVGLAPLGLAAAGLWPRRGAPGGPGLPAGVGRAAAALGGAGLILALGPILIWHDTPTQWPLPYLPLFLGIPGLRGMRAPARFALLALVPLALFAGAGLARLLARLPPGRGLHGAAAGLALALLTAEAAHLPVALQPVAPLPRAIAAPLAAEPGAVLALPLSTFEPLPETLHLLQSTAHWAPLVNGYSGFRPGVYFELVSLVNAAEPSDRLLEALAALGVRRLLVHLEAMPEAERRTWEAARPPASHLVPLAAAEGYRLFRIATPPREGFGHLTAALALPEGLPGGDRLRVGFALENRSGGPWVNPGPLGLAPLRVIWTPEGGGAPIRQIAPAYLPTLLPAGATRSFAVPLAVPPGSGPYRLEIRGPGFTASHRVRLGVPDPAPPDLRAELAWLGPPAPTAMAAGPLPLLVRIGNAGTGPWRETAAGRARGLPFRRLASRAGLNLWWAAADLPDLGSEWPIWGAGDRALWLATPQSYLGQFSLRARWIRDGAIVSMDFIPLPQALFPGQRLTLAWTVPTPAGPGAYQLELAVQAPSLDRLPGAAAEPLRLPVLLRPGPPSAGRPS